MQQDREYLTAFSAWQAALSPEERAQAEELGVSAPSVAAFSSSARPANDAAGQCSKEAFDAWRRERRQPPDSKRELTPDEQSELQGIRCAVGFLCERVISRRDGRRQSAAYIASRVVVFAKLFGGLGDELSLRDRARELGVSVSSLSKIGHEFSARFGMQASWQRVQRAPARTAGKHPASLTQRESHAAANLE